MDLITSEDLEQLIDKIGKAKANKIITVIAKLNKNLTAVMGHEFAKNVLDMDLKRMEVLDEKIIREQATDQEFAEFRYLRDVRINQIVGMVQKYLDNLKIVKKIVKK